MPFQNVAIIERRYEFFPTIPKVPQTLSIARSDSGRKRSRPRMGGGVGGYRSNVPERTYTPRDAENAAPVAPKRTERVDDFADLSFGKIEL